MGETIISPPLSRDYFSADIHNSVALSLIELLSWLPGWIPGWTGETLPTSHRAIIKHNLEQTTALISRHSCGYCGDVESACQPTRQTFSVILWRIGRRRAKMNNLTSAKTVALIVPLFYRELNHLNAVFFLMSALCV